VIRRVGVELFLDKIMIWYFHLPYTRENLTSSKSANKPSTSCVCPKSSTTSMKQLVNSCYC
jgi:hypothetical protein